MQRQLDLFLMIFHKKMRKYLVLNVECLDDCVMLFLLFVFLKHEKPDGMLNFKMHNDFVKLVIWIVCSWS